MVFLGMIYVPYRPDLLSYPFSGKGGLIWPWAYIPAKSGRHRLRKKTSSKNKEKNYEIRKIIAQNCPEILLIESTLTFPMKKPS